MEQDFIYCNYLDSGRSVAIRKADIGYFSPIIEKYSDDYRDDLIREVGTEIVTSSLTFLVRDNYFKVLDILNDRKVDAFEN